MTGLGLPLLYAVATLGGVFAEPGTQMRTPVPAQASASADVLPLLAGEDAAATPPLVWQGVTSIGVQCLVQSEARGHEAALSAALCERVRRIASRGAPAPLRVIQLGDPALISPGTASILVHGSVQSEGRGELLAFTMRPFRASAEQTAVLFGAAPRVAPLGSADAATPALDAALAAALSETLPWQQRPQGPRPIARRP
jgi:hypothetical protein